MKIEIKIEILVRKKLRNHKTISAVAYHAYHKSSGALGSTFSQDLYLDSLRGASHVTLPFLWPSEAAENGRASSYGIYYSPFPSVLKELPTGPSWSDHSKSKPSRLLLLGGDKFGRATLLMYLLVALLVDFGDTDNIVCSIN